jgi:pimeloyl-ACP methyl ester carboxylesterase
MALLATIVSVIVAAGVLYQLIGARRDARRYPAPGRLLDLAGRRLHIVCAGEGTPPVVFESAIAASSLSWTRVLPEIARFTKACAYDRRGLGWSDRGAGAPTVAEMIGDLTQVLNSAAGGDRSVLVGHSFGAFLVCLYASQRPERVSGLVLLDPPSDWDQPTAERQRLLRGGVQLSRLGGILARVGVVRACLTLLTSGAPDVPRGFVKVFGPTAARTLERLVGEVRKLPPEVHPLVQALWCQPKCFSAMADHMAVFDGLAALVLRVGSLADTPLVVVSSGDQTPDTLAKQQQMARLSSDSRHIVAAESGHWIQFDEPDLVAAAIRDVVDRARRRRIPA